MKKLILWTILLCPMLTLAQPFPIDTVPDTSSLAGMYAGEGTVMYLKQYSSSDASGGGWFIARTSSGTLGTDYFAHPSDGVQWVRQELDTSPTLPFTDLSKSPYVLSPSNNAATNATNFQSAISGASEGDLLYLPKGEYYFDTTIVIDKNLRFMGDGKTLTILNFDSIPGGTNSVGISIARTQTDAVNDTTRLSQSTIPNRRYFIVDNAIGFVEGDLFFINDTSKSNPGQTAVTSPWYTGGNKNKGEQHIVDKVVGDTIFIVGKVWDTYNIDRGMIRVRQIDDITVELKNFRVKFGSNDTTQIGISVTNHQDCKFENLWIEYPGFWGIAMIQGINFSLKNSTIKNTNAFGGGYSIDLRGTSNCIVTGNTFINYRSAVEVGSGSNFGPTRNVNIYGNLFMTGGHSRSSTGGEVVGTGLRRGTALASHWGSEFINFHGNTIISGEQVVKMRGSSFNVHNNFVTGRFDLFANVIARGASMRINNNVFDAMTVMRENLTVPADPYFFQYPTDSLFRDSNIDAFVKIGAWYNAAQDTGSYLEIKNNRINGLDHQFLQLFDDVQNMDVSYNDISWEGEPGDYHTFLQATEGTDTVLAQSESYNNHPESFANSANDQWRATRFTSDFSDSLYKIGVTMRGVSTPPDSFTISIWGDSALTKPETKLAESDSIDASSVATADNEIMYFILGSAVYLEEDSTYWIALSASSWDGSNYLHWRANSNASGLSIASPDSFDTIIAREDFPCNYYLYTIGRTVSNSTLIGNTFYDQTGSNIHFNPGNVLFVNTSYSYINKNTGTHHFGGDMAFDDVVTFDESVEIDGGLDLGGTLQIGSDGTHLSELQVGSGTFTTTEQLDTVLISGALITDTYFLTPTGIAYPDTTDVLLADPRADTLIVRRPAGGTSGLVYDYMRIK